jgi:hypothetical protein
MDLKAKNRIVQAQQFQSGPNCRQRHMLDAIRKRMVEPKKQPLSECCTTPDRKHQGIRFCAIGRHPHLFWNEIAWEGV